MQASPDSLLINEASPDTPLWVSKVLSCAEYFYTRRSGIIIVTIFHFAGCALAVWSAINAAQTVGLAHSPVCAARACLFFELSCLCLFCDFLSMLVFNRIPELPTVFTASKQALALAHKQLVELPVMIMIGLLFQLLPVVVWLKGFTSGFSGSGVTILAVVLVTLPHNILNQLSFSFWATQNEAEQRRFEKALVSGHFSYDDAVTAYRTINASRRVLAKQLRLGAACFFFIFMISQAVLLYDYELRPWGSPALLVLFCTQTLAFLLFMTPWIGLHDWPDQLIEAMMDSTELAWTPGEKTNFAALVGATKTKIALFGFEMTPGFRTALPLVFFGWWLYMTELRQFHGFGGFSFDFPQCYNATPSGEHHHGPDW